MITNVFGEGYFGFEVYRKRHRLPEPKGDPSETRHGALLFQWGSEDVVITGVWYGQRMAWTMSDRWMRDRGHLVTLDQDKAFQWIRRLL